MLGVLDTGVIRGSAWDDLNGDGLPFGEPALPDAKVYLDANHNGRWDDGERFQITDAAGEYEFAGLPAGTYTVAQEPAGRTATYPLAVEDTGFEIEEVGPFVGGTFDSMEAAVPLEGGYPAFLDKASGEIIFWERTAGGWDRRPAADAYQIWTEYDLAYQPGTGNPYIAYVDNLDVYVTHFDYADLQWHTETVDVNDSDQVKGLAIAFHPITAEPHLAITETSFAANVYHVWHDGSGWHLELVCDADFSVDHAAIAINPLTGRPAIAFTQWSQPRTYYVEQGPGGWGTPEVIETQDADQIELAFLPSSGTPVVAYRSGDLTLAIGGGTWTKHSVYGGAVEPFGLAVTPDDQVLLAWSKDSTTRQLMLTTWEDGTLWEIEVHDADAPADLVATSHSTIVSNNYAVQIPFYSSGVYGFAASVPAHTVKLGEGATVSGQDFGSHADATPPAPATDGIGASEGNSSEWETTDGTAQIWGRAWNDANGDGEKGSATEEPWLPGVTVYIDTNQNGLFDEGEPSLQTDGSGQYGFTDLAAGTYVVAQQPPAGWSRTSPVAVKNGFLDEEVGPPEADTFGIRMEVAAPVEGGYPGMVEWGNGELICWSRIAEGWNRHVVPAATTDVQFGFAYEPGTGEPYVAYGNSGTVWITHFSFDDYLWHTEDVFDGDALKAITGQFNPTTGEPEVAALGSDVLRYFRRGPSGWEAEVIDADVNTDLTAADISLAFDPGTNQPAVSYEKRLGDGTRTVRLATYDGGTWSSETVDEVNAIETELRFLLGAGTPVVAYRFGGQTLRLAHPGTADWEYVDVEAGANGGTNDRFGMDVTPDDEVYLSWTRNATPKDLRLSKWDGTLEHLTPGQEGNAQSSAVLWNNGALQVLYKYQDWTWYRSRWRMLSSEPSHKVTVADGDVSFWHDFGTMQTSAPAQVVARHVFYNDSKWDESPDNPDGDPAANEYDDNAIAPDKTALLLGETAEFANYTSFSKGINGIMVDIAGLAATPTAADFEFKMGNDAIPDAWPAAPDPSVTVRPGEGVGGSDRVTLVWPNYDTVSPDPTTQAVAKQWLQVTVLDTDNTGLTQPDVFYFGNALGDSGLGNFGGAALVNAVDSGAVRDNPHNPYVIPAPLDDFADFNRDQWVNAVDFGFVRDNATNPTTALKLITAPEVGPLSGPEGAPAPARIDRGTLHDAAIAEPDTQRVALADADPHLRELHWLGAFDLPAAQNRPAKITASAQAAVEKLLATL